MGVNAEILILGPFREVAERGNEAVANAQDVDDLENDDAKHMLKAAQAVAKEGERALRRLRPLWDGQVGKYGDAFTDALIQNEEIEKRRHQLEDLLYDFEDYIEPHTFAAERYAEIQMATKSLALEVIDFIKKTKLETSKSPAYVPPASSKFPPLPPLPSSARSTRSASVSSASGAPVGRPQSRSRRPPTPVRGEPAEQSLLQLTPPALPPRSPGHTVPSLRSGDAAPSELHSDSPDAVPLPLRGSTARRNYERLNMNSVRSQRSYGTSRSRISQVSVGSLDLQPPPYTAGESTASLPPSPRDESLQSPSRVLTPDRLPSESPRPQVGADSHGEHPQNALPTSSAGTEASNVTYSVFPIPRPSHSNNNNSSSSSSSSSNNNHNNNGTRITAWMLEQANSSPRNQYQAQRPSTRHEAHTLQAVQSLQTMTIPEDQAVGVVRPKHASIIDFSPLTPMLAQLGRFSIDSSTTASSPSVSTNDPNVSQQSRMSPLSQSTSLSSLQNKPEPPLPSRLSDDTIETRLTPLTLPAAAVDHQHHHHHRPQLSPLPFSSEAHSPLPRAFEPVPGAIPEEWATVVSDHTSFTSPSLSSSGAPAPQPRGADTSIGPRSSLYALNGFCPSSQIFKSTSHQDGIRKLAGHVAGVSAFTARCETCSYGHAFAELDLDVNQKSPRATFPRAHGVLFRIRFLYKSHLASQRPSEAFYGCLFCAQTGTVTREGDATVFRSSDDLLRHLARHPQPLPEVTGVTVLYGKEVLASDPRVHDFDLWLTEDPAPLPAGLPTDLATVLPVATAGRSHVQRYAEKKLPKPSGKRDADLLQFFVGARIIGVEFPSAWAGKWATGWHDGEFGCFPAKCVELEKPKPGRLDAPPMQYQGLSAVSVSVVARWKFDPTASIRDAVEKGWVGFDKGERITNVGWPVVVEGVGGGGSEAWCWSGTNSKGKFGVFPRSHVDESTLRDDMRPGTAAGTGGGNNGKRKKESGGKGGKSLFGVRRRASITSTRSGGGITEIV